METRGRNKLFLILFLLESLTLPPLNKQKTSNQVFYWKTQKIKKVKKTSELIFWLLHYPYILKQANNAMFQILRWWKK